MTRRGRVIGDAAAASGLAGAAALGGLAAAGRPLLGAALALGLLLGAGNQLLAASTFGWDLDFRAVSLLRLAAITIILASAGVVLGWTLLPAAAAGVALAELLLAGAGLREVRRA